VAYARRSRAAIRQAASLEPTQVSVQRRKYLYWVSTSLLAIGMVGAGVQEVRQAPEILEAAHRLGYPDYVLTLLGLAKLVGAPIWSSTFLT
jgi:hypothetical protein